jgi:hypothetical protein
MNKYRFGIDICDKINIHVTDNIFLYAHIGNAQTCIVQFCGVDGRLWKRQTPTRKYRIGVYVIATRQYLNRLIGFDKNVHCQRCYTVAWWICF